MLFFLYWRLTRKTSPLNKFCSVRQLMGFLVETLLNGARFLMELANRMTSHWMYISNGKLTAIRVLCWNYDITYRITREEKKYSQSEAVTKQFITAFCASGFLSPISFFFPSRFFANQLIFVLQEVEHDVTVDCYFRFKAGRETDKREVLNPWKQRGNWRRAMNGGDKLQK